MSATYIGGAIKAGSTGVLLPVEIRLAADSTENDGIAFGDVVSVGYWRVGTSTKANNAPSSGTLGTHPGATSWSWVEVDATYHPGVYQLAVPDAAFAAGAVGVVISVVVASSFVASFFVPLTTDNVQSGDTYAELPANFSSLGIEATGEITAVNDGVVVASGGITAAAFDTDSITADALKADAVTKIQSGLATAAALATVDSIIDEIILDSNELQTDWADGGRLDLILDAASAPSAADVADAVWDEAITGHLSAGSTGLKLNSAASAGDPWSTALPGAYASGTAGYIMGNMSSTLVAALQAGGVVTVSAVNFEVKKTGSYEYTFTAYDSNGDPIDLSTPGNYTITATAKYARDPSITQAFTVTTVDLGNGQFKIALTPTNTSSMRVGIWDFDCKMTSPDTLTVYFTNTYQLEISQNIT